MVEKIVIVSQFDSVVRDFRNKRPEWIYGVPMNEARKMVYSSLLYLDDFFPIRSDILMLPQRSGTFNVLPERVIQHVKKRNKKLWVWKYEGETVININSTEDLLSIKELGIDGVFTDYPEKLMEEFR
jgi:hypothetical protein